MSELSVVDQHASAVSSAVNELDTLESDVASRIRTIVCDSLDVAPEDVSMEASFVQDLGADSLDVVDLAIRFETEFSLSIKDHDYLHLTRLCDAQAYIVGRLRGTIPAKAAAAPVQEATASAGE